MLNFGGVKAETLVAKNRQYPQVFIFYTAAVHSIVSCAGNAAYDGHKDFAADWHEETPGKVVTTHF